MGIATTEPERIQLGYHILELRIRPRRLSVDRRKPGAGSSGRPPASSPLYRPDLHGKSLVGDIGPVAPAVVLTLKWDQRFESAFLQRRVHCDPAGMAF